MRKIALSFIAILLCTVLAAQNNPYELNDECYPYFAEAEILAGKEG